MKILAFDTATQDLILCLMTENKTFSKIVHCKNGHSLILMSEIHQILAENNIKLDELDGIACVVGVGSFTGIRIGVSTARALCQVLKIPALAINSLFYRAYNVGCQQEKSVVMNASTGKVYYAKFSKGNEVIQPEGHCEMDKVLDILNTKDKIYSDIDIKGANTFNNLDAALAEYIKGQLNYFTDYRNLVPHYLIKSQAENNYDKKLECK